MTDTRPTFEECMAEFYAEYVRSWLDQNRPLGA